MDNAELLRALETSVIWVRSKMAAHRVANERLLERALDVAQGLRMCVSEPDNNDDESKTNTKAKGEDKEKNTPSYSAKC